jgi:hypothetical protein
MRTAYGEKQAIVDSIADILAISRDSLGPGSKEHRSFLVSVANALGLQVTTSDTKHTISKKIIIHLGGKWGSGYYSSGSSIQTATFQFIYDRLLDIYGSNRAKFMEAVARAIATTDPTKPPPPGNRFPVRVAASSSEFDRCPKVVAWILLKAGGRCEHCMSQAPFTKPDGTLYLEVHHVQTLATGGPDTVENAVALCPNCHRAAHLSRKRRDIQLALERRLLDRGYGSSTVG